MSSFGQNINDASGAIVSPNVISILPEPGGPTTGLMNLTFMQFLSKHFGVVLGKISTLGADDNAFAHDYHSTFLNTGPGFQCDLHPRAAHRVRRRPRHPALGGRRLHGERHRPEWDREGQRPQRRLQ